MNKKVITGIILAIIIVAIAIGAVVMSNSKNSNDINVAQSNLNTSIDNNDIVQDEDNTLNNKNTIAENKTNDNSKILVAYFSVPETDNPNNMTQEEENSAIVVDGKVLGNTQYVAQLISERTGADVYRIEAKNDYPLDHTTLVNQAKEEQNNNARPEIKDKINNFDDYDTIFIGYPIWWSDMPQILYTFLESYNFDGKTVIPFSTHGGSGLAGTVITITTKLPNANVESNAFTMSRNSMEDAPEEVNTWLTEINM